MPGEKVIRFRPGRIEVTLGGMLLLKLPLWSTAVTEGMGLPKNRCALALAVASKPAKTATPAMDTFRRISFVDVTPSRGMHEKISSRNRHLFVIPSGFSREEPAFQFF